MGTTEGSPPSRVRVTPRFAEGLSLALLIAFFAGMCGLTFQGEFINSDYEKISQNRANVMQPLLHRLLERDAGYEPGYYRPLENVVVSALARRVGIDQAGPFRVASTLALGLATLALYWLARFCGFPPFTGLICALFFALHPFNSWYYFQGTWLGNPLSIAVMVVGWRLYEGLRSCPERQWVWRMLALMLTMFVACLCKDSAALLVVMLVPIAIWGRVGSRQRRWSGVAAVVAGSAFYFALRGWVMGPETADVMRDKLGYAVSHAGAAILQHTWALLTGTNWNYARRLEGWWGWPLTMLLVIGIGVVLWRARRRPMIAILVWCGAVALTEIVLGSAYCYDLVSTRVTLLIAILSLLGAAIWHACPTSPRRHWVMIILAGGLAWYGVQGLRHVHISLDQERFYAYHNDRLYSWKLLLSWARLNGDRGDWELAEQSARQSLAVKPRYGTNYFLAGYLEEQGKFEEAVIHYTEALRGYPNYAFIYNDLGGVLAKQGKLAEAAARYSEALQLAPNYTEAHVNLIGLSARLRELEASPPQSAH